MRAMRGEILFAVALCVQSSGAWAADVQYETKDNANAPFCLSPDRYKDGMAAAKRNDADMFAKTGCVVPEGGLLVKVMGESVENLYKMQIVGPSGKKYIVYAPLNALTRKKAGTGP